MRKLNTYEICFVSAGMVGFASSGVFLGFASNSTFPIVMGTVAGSLCFVLTLLGISCLGALALINIERKIKSEREKERQPILYSV